MGFRRSWALKVPRCPARGGLALIALAGAALAGCSAAPPAAADGDTAWAALSAPDAVAAPADVVPEGYDAAVRVVTPIAPPHEDPPVYRNAIRPYLWMAGVDADLSVRGTSADVHESFSDIWDKLDFGIMLGYEHWFDGWSLLLDSFYVKLEEDAKVGPASVDSTLEEAYMEASAVVPIVEDREVEGILGARGWYVRSELDAGPGEISKTSQWLDPIVGLRWHTHLGEDWLLNLRGDVGGFDIGSASQFTWQGTAVLGYEVSDRTTLAVGYRYLRVDRLDDDGGNGTDFALSGALAGLEFRF
jgi:hypothetical protein